MRNGFSKVSNGIIIVWALGMFALAVYVPFGEYIIGEDSLLAVKHLIRYGWIFAEVETVTGYKSFSLINYDLLVLNLMVWTAVCFVLAFIFNDENKQ